MSNSNDNISRFVELMNSWRACWSSCVSGCSGCDDDLDDLFAQLCQQNCSGCSECSDDCEEECDDCSCANKRIKGNSEIIQDDGCFCRNPKCNDFVPMAEPDGDDGMILCWKCANGI